MKALNEFFLAMYFKLTGVLRSKNGQTLIEYALILVLIAVVIIVALQLSGKKVCNMYSNVTSTLP